MRRLRVPPLSGFHCHYRTGLRLSPDERDHLFLLAGHATPGRVSRTNHVAPAVLRVLDRLEDTPAQVVTDLAETLAQTRFTGPARSMIYRWFTDPGSRSVYPEADQDRHARSTQGPRSTAVIRQLQASSPEFTHLWDQHEVGFQHDDSKTIVRRERTLAKGTSSAAYFTHGQPSSCCGSCYAANRSSTSATSGTSRKASSLAGTMRERAAVRSLPEPAERSMTR